MLVVVPPLVLVFVSIFELMFNVVNITSLVICGLFYFGCLVLSLVLQLFWVPLRRDEYTTEPMVETAKARIAEKKEIAPIGPIRPIGPISVLLSYLFLRQKIFS